MRADIFPRAATRACTSLERVSPSAAEVFRVDITISDSDGDESSEESMAEDEELIPRGSSITTSSCSFAELQHELSTSIGDWIAVGLLVVIGFRLDGMRAFEIDIGPQLAHDYTITYPHTPAAQQQVPAPLLWRIVFLLPLVLLLPLVFLRRPGVPA